MSEQMKQKAVDIRAKITGGLVYGVPVNMDDIDTVLVAAYLLGYSEGGRTTHIELGMKGDKKNMDYYDHLC